MSKFFLIFFKPCKIYLPSIYGILVFIIVSLCFVPVMFYIYPDYLTVNKPLGNGFLIVEGWIPKRLLKEAVQVYNTGHYQAIVVSGGLIEENECSWDFKTFAEKTAYEIGSLGVDKSFIIVAPAEPTTLNRTYVSALAVKRKLESSYQVKTIDIFSKGAHTRRSMYLYSLAFGDQVEVGGISAPSTQNDLKQWWTYSAGVKDMLSETVSLLWAVCCYRQQ